MSDAKVLTSKEAYLAMFSFLDEYYQVTRIDAIGSLLSSMSLMADGEPMDIAFSDEWEEAVKKVRNGQVDAYMRLIKPEPSEAE